MTLLAGPAALVAFGLWHVPSVAETHDESVAGVMVAGCRPRGPLLVLVR